MEEVTSNDIDGLLFDYGEFVDEYDKFISKMDEDNVDQEGLVEITSKAGKIYRKLE